MKRETKDKRQQMRFSVVTPCLNSVEHLPQCAGSIREQSQPAHEHLVMDGGSSDGTTDWLKQQQSAKWVSEPDEGMYDALNKGFSRTEGDVLSWLNSDEQYLPHTLETACRAFQQDATADILFGDFVLVTPDGHAVSVRREIPLRRWYAINGTLYVTSCTMFIRRRAWERTGPFDISYKVCGDKEWIMRAQDAGCRFLHVPELLGLFTVTTENLSHHPGARKESARIRRKFGAHRLAALRLLARGCRQAEKLFRGCQGKHRISYRFMTSYSDSCNMQAKVGSRWQWSN